MENLLQETIQAITESGRTIADVMFVGSRDGKFRMTWDKFTERADFEYYDGYGSQHIATDLIVYFNDHSYMDRREYDGSERWNYNTPLVYEVNDPHKDFEKLGNNEVMWDTVAEINELEENKDEDN